MKKQTNGAQPERDVQREVHPKWACRVATALRTALGLPVVIDTDARGTTSVIIDRGPHGLVFITLVYFGVFSTTYFNGLPDQSLTATLKSLGIDGDAGAAWLSQQTVRKAARS